MKNYVHVAEFCKNDHLNNLLESTATNSAEGWTINCNEGVWNSPSDKCSNWYGYIPNDDVGSISTTFKGSGRARLDFGNCYKNGRVKAYLDGKMIGKGAGKYTFSKVVEFNFQHGSILEINEQNTATIQFNSLKIISFNGCPGKTQEIF